MNLNEKLAKLTTKESATWLEEAEWRRKNRGWLTKSAQIALTVLGELRRRKMTQKELAERMGMSAQQVNKIVKGQENLTLETLDKLERALSIQLLYNGTNDSNTIFSVNKQLIALLKKHRAISFQDVTRFSTMSVCVFQDLNPAHIISNKASKQYHNRFTDQEKEMNWFSLHSQRS